MKKALSLALLIASPYALSVDYDSALEYLNSSSTVACATSENQPLCDNPSSMCSTLPKDNFETEKYVIRKAASPTKERDPFEKPYADLLAGTEGSETAMSKLLAAGESAVFKKFKISNSDVEKTIDKVKASLIKQAEAEQSAEVAERIKSKITSIRFKNAQALASTPWEVKNFTETCGADGLIKNAFYDPNDNALTICPGFLLDNLLKSNGDLNNLTMVIGHEIGHSLHSADFRMGGFLRTPKHFEVFMDCMLENFITDKSQKFGTNKETVEQLEKNGIPKLEAEIEKVSKAKPVDINYLSDLKRSLGTSSGQLERFKHFAASSDQLMSVRGELMADYQSAATVRDLLQLSPQKQRAVQMKQMLSFYCDNYTANEKKVLALKWNGINPASHPPSRFRLEHYFRSPEIRSLLGCSPLQSSEKPWCSAKGATR